MASAQTTLATVLEQLDLAVLVLGGLDPASMVALGRVSRNVRAARDAAISAAPRLLVQAAENAGALTKTHLMGWFALTSAEADALPRARYMRRGGGYYFLYRQSAFEQVIGGDKSLLVGIADWIARLRLRQTPARKRSYTQKKKLSYPQKKKLSYP